MYILLIMYLGYKSSVVQEVHYSRLETCEYAKAQIDKEYKNYNSWPITVCTPY